MTEGVEVGDVRDIYKVTREGKEMLLVSDNESTIVLEVLKSDKKVEVKQVEESEFSSQPTIAFCS